MPKGVHGNHVRASRQHRWMPGGKLAAFLRESLAIEGLLRDPTQDELTNSEWFLRQPIALASLLHIQHIYAPGCPLRDRSGMNVYVGSHVPPLGGLGIEPALEAILEQAASSNNPWRTHCAFETLHPFMDGNGRTGRILWARHMLSLGRWIVGGAAHG